MDGDCDDAEVFTYPGAPELCDGPDLNGEGCVSQGFLGGTLACYSSCDGFVVDLRLRAWPSCSALNIPREVVENCLLSPSLLLSRAR